MTNETEADAKARQSQEKPSILTKVAAASIGSPPATSGQGKKDKPSKPTHYGKYWMWPVVTVWRPIHTYVLSFFDNHHGAITAVATIVIGFLTYQYVKYSGKQWVVTTQQLDAFQKTEGAHIGAGQIQWDMTGGQIRIPIDNYGRIPSPSVHLFPHVYRFIPGSPPTIIYTKNYDFGGDQTEVPPGSGRYGVTVPAELGDDEMNKLQAGTEVMWVSVTIRYDDGFGHTLQNGPCFAFNPTHPLVWDSCPTFDMAHLPKKPPQ